MSQRDFTHRGWIAALALIAVLAGVSLIPPQSIGGIHLRRANILSDLLRFEDRLEESAQTLLLDEEEFRVDMEQVAERIEADTAPRRVQTIFEWTILNDHIPYGKRIPDTLLLQPMLIPIEDFDTTGRRGMQAFCDTLLNAQRPIRIAFLGDSFIEGDILTADLREKLQLAYGGSGAGFAPMASPLTGFRRTIKTQSKGWTSYNIMQRKAAPAGLRDNFFISGWACQPSVSASTRWETTDARKRLNTCSTVRILFVSPAESRVEVTLNDTLRRVFTVAADAAVRQIAVTAPRIRSLEFKVLSGTEGFIGYGAIFESQGVVVDNYSVRSNNGQAMFWTNPSVNAQINAMLPYDLVILQYGLNIMQAGVRDYSNYSQQIGKMITYVRECFPTAAVLVLGVSDRAVRTDEGFVPMDAIPHMLRYQRRAAEQTGAAFWNTSEAMRSLGGMERFVANGWAGKDFTHINYAGGRQVAYALFDALNQCAAKAATEQKMRNSLATKIFDSEQLLELNRQLTTAPQPLLPNLPHP